MVLFAQVLVIGGGGRVGSAATIHLLSDAGWGGALHVTIAGRRSPEAMKDVYEEIVEVWSRHASAQQHSAPVCRPLRLVATRIDMFIQSSLIPHNSVILQKICFPGCFISHRDRIVNCHVPRISNPSIPKHCHVKAKLWKCCRGM